MEWNSNLHHVFYKTTFKNSLANLTIPCSIQNWTLPRTVNLKLPFKKNLKSEFYTSNQEGHNLYQHFKRRTTFEITHPYKFVIHHKLWRGRFMHCYREVSLGTRYGEIMVINDMKKTIVGSRTVFNLMGGMIMM